VIDYYRVGYAAHVKGVVAGKYVQPVSAVFKIVLNWIIYIRIGARQGVYMVNRRCSETADRVNDWAGLPDSNAGNNRIDRIVANFIHETRPDVFFRIQIRANGKILVHCVSVGLINKDIGLLVIIGGASRGERRFGVKDLEEI